MSFAPASTKPGQQLDHDLVAARRVQRYQLTRGPPRRPKGAPAFMAGAVAMTGSPAMRFAPCLLAVLLPSEAVTAVQRPLPDGAEHLADLPHRLPERRDPLLGNREFHLSRW